MRKYQPPKDHFFRLPNSVFVLPLDAAQNHHSGYGNQKTSLQKAFKVLKARRLIAVQKHRNPYGYANNEYHLLSLENPEIYRQPDTLPLMGEEQPA